MRVGTMRAGADDDECHLRMSFGDNGFGDVGGDVGLGPSGHQKVRNPGVHPVDGRARLAQRVDLGGVLDHPQLAQHVGGQHRQRAEDIGQRQQVQRGHRVGDRRRRRSAAQGGGDQLVGIVAVDPIPHRHAKIGDGGLLQRRQFQSRYHDRRVTGDRQHQRSEAFEGLRARADQIAQVISRGDHQSGQAGLRGGGRRGRHPAAVDLCVEAVRTHAPSGYWQDDGHVRTAVAARRRQHVVSLVLRRPVLDHLPRRPAGQRGPRLPGLGGHGDHPTPTRPAGGLPGSGLASAVPGRSHPVVQSSSGRRGKPKRANRCRGSTGRAVTASRDDRRDSRRVRHLHRRCRGLRGRRRDRHAGRPGATRPGGRGERRPRPAAGRPRRRRSPSGCSTSVAV